MECDIKVDGEWILIIVKGAINFNSSEELKLEFEKVLGDGAINVRLNLTDVPISNSSGIGYMLMLYKSLKKRGGTLEIKGISKNLGEMMKLIKIDKLIKIEDC